MPYLGLNKGFWCWHTMPLAVQVARSASEGKIIPLFVHAQSPSMPHVHFIRNPIQQAWQC